MTLVVGVDLGGTKIQAIAYDGDHVRGQAREATPLEGTMKDIGDAVIATARGALEDAGAEAADVAAIGVGAPGQPDEQGTTLLFAPNLPGGDQPFELGPYVADGLGVERG